MIVEYVDLLKSSYIDSFLCYDKLQLPQWLRLEFVGSQWSLWFILRDHMAIYIYIVVLRMIMMPSCSHFIFIDTSISKHVDIFFDFSFRLRTSEVYAWGSWYVHFASCFYINIYCIMGCYYTLYHNTYAFSLLLYKVYMKTENADSCISHVSKHDLEA